MRNISKIQVAAALFYNKDFFDFFGEIDFVRTVKKVVCEVIDYARVFCITTHVSVIFNYKLLHSYYMLSHSA